MGYDRLAAMLDGIPPIVVIREHLAYMVATGNTVLGLKESLVRSIREEMADGWTCRGREWPAVRLLAGWGGSMIATCGLESIEAQIDIVSNHIIENAEMGWLPTSVNDSLVEAAFREAGLE
jgi:hypothetical protein